MNKTTFIGLVLGLFFTYSTQAQAEEINPHLEEITAHPAFLPLIDDSLPWKPLSANTLKSDSSQALILLFTPFRHNLPEQNFATRQVMLSEFNTRYTDQFSFLLASPAWWPILDERLIFSSEINLAQNSDNYLHTSSSPLNVLTAYPQIEVLGYQIPDLGFRLADFYGLLDGTLQRHQIDSQRIGQESRNARMSRVDKLTTVSDPEQVIVDLSNIYTNAASLLSRAREIDSSSPSEYLQSIHTLTQANEFALAGEVGQTQIEKLHKSARKVLEQSWQDWETGEFQMFVSQHFRDRKNAIVYSLGESSRMLLLEASIPPKSKRQQARAQRLLLAIEEMFISADGRVSDQVTQNSQGSLTATGWCQLHNRALLCQARIAWRGKEADLSWLKTVSERARDPDNAQLPPALFPSFPGDPDSLLGIIYVGQACLMAAEVHLEHRQLWIDRSAALFHLMEKRYSAGERGYYFLPRGHELEIPPETFFVSTPDNKNSLLTQHGNWLRKLESLGVQAAGKRADELLNYYTRWRLIRAASAADFFFTRGVTLQKNLE